MLRPVLVGPGCFAVHSLLVAGGAAVVLVGIDRCCVAGVGAGDDADGVGVAPIAFVVGVGVAAGALVVVAAAVPAVVANEGSMTHMERDGCWVQLVLKVLMVAVEVEEVAVAVAVAVAAVAGDEDDTADCGTMNYASGRIVAADSAHGSSARLGKKAAKTAGESCFEVVGTWSIVVASRETDVVFDLIEEWRPNCA